MRMQFPMIAAWVLMGISAAPAEADVSWSGPGWYVEASATGFDVSLASGPYSSEADCKAAQPADNDDYVYDCVYETADPTGDGGPQG